MKKTKMTKRAGGMKISGQNRRRRSRESGVRSD
jgi:hypothetical protein